MIVLMIILIFLVGFQFLVIIALYADRMVYMYARGDDFGMLKMDDKVYDILKWIAIVALPALSTFIVVISKIWGWSDMGSMIAQTITAVAVLLGALLGISCLQYKNEGSGDGNS